MKVKVIRGSGGSLAPETLVDPLCSDMLVGVDKGKAYLYDEGMDKCLYTVVIPYRKPMEVFKTVTVQDSSLGESFVGRIISHEISITNKDGAKDITSTLVIERSIEKV